MKKYLLLIPLFSFIFHSSHVGAQSVSYGDTIVRQTFGAGVANPGPPLPSGDINLTYVDNTCPNDGQYTIANYTGGCYSGHWTTTKDHTGNTNGYFLLVNASEPGQYFFVDTVTGLCDGQSAYQFSAWIINMQLNTKTNLPNLSFSISYVDSNNVSHDTSFNTGDIPFMTPETWNPYSYIFTKPAGVTSLVLKILDYAKSGGGNDFGIDDITFCAAGPSITDSINGILTNISPICKTSLVTLSASSSDNSYYNPPVYEWQKSIDSGATWVNDTLANDSKNTFSFYPDSIGSYQYRVSVYQSGTAKCATTSIPFYLTVFPPVKDTVTVAGVCDSYSWHGKTYTSNGYYTFDTSLVECNCDSLTVLKLTLKHSTTSTIDTTVCLTYTWPLSGQTYKASGSYPYDIIGANSVGCDSIVTLALTVESPLTVDPIIPPSSFSDTILSGETVAFTDNTNNGDWVSIMPAIATISGSGNTAIIKGEAPGIDTIKYIVSNVCNADTASFPIVVSTTNVFIPNLFSPNGDEHNDIFYVRGSPSLYSSVELWVFNSWGNLIHHSKGAIDDPSNGWDGRYDGNAQPIGVYAYVAKLTEANGNTVITKKGSITLIR